MCVIMGDNVISNKNPHKKTSLSVLSTEHLFIKWSSTRLDSLTHEKVITVALCVCVCRVGDGTGSRW